LRLLGEIFSNALDRRENRLELEEQVRFEMLLAEISGRFVNLPADRVDSEIADAVRHVCECLGLDIAALWQWSYEVGSFLLTHLYGSLEVPLPDGTDASECFPWLQQQMLAGRVVTISSLEEMPAEASRDVEIGRRLGIKSNLTIPLAAGGRPPIGTLAFSTTRAERNWPEALVKRLQLVAQIFINALARKRSDEQLKMHLKEIEDLKQRLEKENIYLREELIQERGFGKIIGSSEALNYVLFRVGQVAPTDATVLILGETGTGIDGRGSKATLSDSMSKNAFALGGLQNSLPVDSPLTTRDNLLAMKPSINGCTSGKRTLFTAAKASRPSR
jgi:formate hydrogenlyase transcriptional activator